MLAFFALVYHARAQGCSDAGFCTIGAMKPQSRHSELLNRQINVASFVGKSDHNISVYGFYLDYKHHINDKLNIDAKLTSLGQSSSKDKVSVFGLGDVTASLNYKLFSPFILTFGVKAPLRFSGTKRGEQLLPLAYQSSLGTWDVLAGLSYYMGALQLSAGYQYALSQSYTAPSYKRSPDVLLRASYAFAVNNQLSLSPGVLAIYHLADDMQGRTKIEGSQGLTLNGTVYAHYLIDRSNSLELGVGMPFVVRKERPDGLTRKFVLNLQYGLRF